MTTIRFSSPAAQAFILHNFAQERSTPRVLSLLPFSLTLYVFYFFRNGAMNILKHLRRMVARLLLIFLAVAPASAAQQSPQAPPAEKYEDLTVEQTARRLLRRVDPVHPEEAKGQSGVVLVGFFINPDGIPIHVQALSGPAAFHKAAITAVSRWRYRVPYPGTTTIGRANVRFDGHSEQLQRYREYDRVFQAGEGALADNNFSEAASSFSRALELAETFPDEMSQATLQTMSYLIISLLHLDRFDDAETIGLRLLDFVETKPVASPEMPGLAIIYVVATYMRTLRFDRAEAFLDRASGFVENSTQEKVNSRSRAFRRARNSTRRKRHTAKPQPWCPQPPLPPCSRSCFAPSLTACR